MSVSERVEVAAFRYSGGNLKRLAEAVELAQIDWRDLFVAANFADDADAHLGWRPGPFDAET